MVEGPETGKPRDKKGGKRYSEKQKASRLAKYHELIRSGRGAVAAAKEVGVSYVTLLKWQKEAGQVKTPAKSRKAKPYLPLRRTRPPMQSPRPTKTGNLTLVTPEGLRIEGISARELIEVLKALR